MKHRIDRLIDAMSEQDRKEVANWVLITLSVSAAVFVVVFIISTWTGGKECALLNDTRIGLGRCLSDDACRASMTLNDYTRLVQAERRAVTIHCPEVSYD